VLTHGPALAGLLDVSFFLIFVHMIKSLIKH